MHDVIDSSQIATLRGQLLKDEPLSRYTSWRTGGPADYLYIPADLEDLSQFLRSVSKSIPVTWLGLGSNTLIRDGGLEGVVIITQGALSKMSQLAPDQIRAEAGVSAAQLARHTARLGTTGLEFMAGIPGTVGGALAMNAGCWGSETWRFVKAVETISRDGEVKVRPAEDFQIGYRHVAKPCQDEWFVAGHFFLRPGDKEVSLNQIRELLERRNSSQPTGTANCGSVFRNPPNNFAGRLIEECGLKGKFMGGACVSEKHANFIINEQGATSADIEGLIADVRKTVEDKTGIQLIPEVCIIGRA